MVKLYTDLDRSTTNEVNNLDSILILKDCCSPVVATHHVAVQFDRDTRGW